MLFYCKVHICSRRCVSSGGVELLMEKLRLPVPGSREFTEREIFSYNSLCLPQPYSPSPTQGATSLAGGLSRGINVFGGDFLGAALGRACRGPVPHPTPPLPWGDVLPGLLAPKIQEQASASPLRKESFRQESINKMRLAANKLELQGHHLDNN